jgi:hypothetical protein
VRVCVCGDLHREALRGPDLRKPVEIIHHKKKRKKNEGNKNEGKKKSSVWKKITRVKNIGRKKNEGGAGGMWHALSFCVCVRN